MAKIVGITCTLETTASSLTSGRSCQKHGLTAVMRLVSPRHRDVQAATLAQQFPDRVQPWR